MLIGIIIPTTTNKTSWKNIKETHLFNIFIKSFLSTMCKKYDYNIYLGVDDDDKIYNNDEEFNEIMRFQTVFKNVKIIKKVLNVKKGWVTNMWNQLFQIAYDDGCDYFYQCGDDINFKKSGWVTKSIQLLENNNDIGLSGPMDFAWLKATKKNPKNYVHTQAFVSRKHMEIFGYFFPKCIKNWFCDNWITQVYYQNNKFYHLKTHLIENKGGDPRYDVVNKRSYGDLIEKLIDSGKNKIKNFK